MARNTTNQFFFSIGTENGAKFHQKSNNLIHLLIRDDVTRSLAFLS